MKAERFSNTGKSPSLAGGSAMTEQLWSLRGEGGNRFAESKAERNSHRPSVLTGGVQVHSPHACFQEGRAVVGSWSQVPWQRWLTTPTTGDNGQHTLRRDNKQKNKKPLKLLPVTSAPGSWAHALSLPAAQAPPHAPGMGQGTLSPGGGTPPALSLLHPEWSDTCLEEAEAPSELPRAETASAAPHWL